jgi:hypothetical protein
MKTKSGKNWYVQDLDCLNEEFLKEIIVDLLMDKDNLLFSLYGLREKLREKRMNVSGLGNIQARLDGIIKEIEE